MTDDDHRCTYCGRWFVVASLARWHETHRCENAP